MKPKFYDLVSVGTVSKLTIILILVLSFGFFLTQGVQAKDPPPVGKPALVGTWCPACKAYIDCPSGKMPSKCPHCPYSFGQKAKPQPSPSHGGPYMPFHGPGNMYRQPVQRQSDDRLYYDGIETRGGLKTRHFDPDGLAARAEKWGQEMRHVDEQSQKKKDALARSLDNDKKDLLEKDGKAIALPQLKNPFADDPNVVDLSATKGTVVITPKQTQQAPNEHTYMQQLNDEARYAHMSSSDLRWLADQYPNNSEIQSQTKIMEKLADERDSLEFKHMIVRGVDDIANEHLEKRNKSVDSMAENAADQLIPGIGGIALKTAMSEDSVAEKRKELISFSTENIWDGIIESSDIYTKSSEVFTGKLGESLTKKLLIVPTVYEFASDATKAGYHQYRYNEQSKILDVTGRPIEIMGDWERVNRQIYDESAKLHTLISREKQATNATP